MFKETLAAYQPTVYQTLKNALERKQLSHCYLFVGQKGTYKLETAFLVAQSLVCEHADPFACESCSSCRRIAEKNYADLIYLDGARTIKIEAIEKLQQQFQKTALEVGGHKIFIINDCENMTAKAANSLLKFIEEPYGDMTGIFITTAPERVLPTIVSRCQNINFHPLPKAIFYQQALAEGVDELNAHFIANLVSTQSEISPLYSAKAYNKAVELFAEFTALLFEDKSEAVLYLQSRFSRINKSDRANFRDTLKYFVELSLLFVSDYLNQYTGNDETYTHLLASAHDHPFDYQLYMKTMIETRDSLNLAANGLLLVDQMLFKLMEVS